MVFEIYSRNDKKCVCKVCDKVFTSVKGKEVCSDACSEKRKTIWLAQKRKNRKEFKIVCLYCEKVTIMDKNPGRRAYCNDECKDAAGKARKDAERAHNKKTKKPKRSDVGEINPMFSKRGNITYRGQG